MLKAREILRLKHEVGLSLRGIAQACNCGKTTVSEVLKRAEKAGCFLQVLFAESCKLKMQNVALCIFHSFAVPDFR